MINLFISWLDLATYTSFLFLKIFYEHLKNFKHAQCYQKSFNKMVRLEGLQKIFHILLRQFFLGGT